MAKGGGNSGVGKSGNAGRGSGHGGRGPGNRRPSGGGGGTGGNTGGTRHKSSSVEGTPMITMVYGIAVAVGLVVIGLGTFFAHGYGLV
jgi:hypothetical protein